MKKEENLNAMKRVTLTDSSNIVDYVLAYPENCSGRKIFTDKNSFEKILGLKIGMIPQNGKFDCSYESQDKIIEASFVKEGTNCFWLNSVKKDGEEKLKPVNKKLEPIYIVNAPVITTDRTIG